MNFKIGALVTLNSGGLEMEIIHFILEPQNIYPICLCRWDTRDGTYYSVFDIRMLTLIFTVPSDEMPAGEL